jgi:hypothetical protein
MGEADLPVATDPEVERIANELLGYFIENKMSETDLKQTIILFLLEMQEVTRREGTGTERQRQGEKR